MLTFNNKYYNNFLEGIAACSHGGIVVAASNLNLSKWTGELFYFNDLDEIDFSKSIANMKITANLTNIISIGNNRFVISTLSGTVMLVDLNISDDLTANFYKIEENNCHDNNIHSISSNHDNTKLISTGQDKSISIYDINIFKPIGSYLAHHSEVIAGSFMPAEMDIFLTADQDNNFILWDFRKPKPAKVLDIAKLLNTRTSSISLQTGQNNVLAIGTEDGQLITTNIYNPSVVSISQPHTKLLSKISLKPNSSNYVASCGHDSKVILTDVSSSNGKIIYEDVKHNDYVKDLMWINNNLFSCSWDGKVAFRKIENLNVAL